MSFKCFAFVLAVALLPQGSNASPVPNGTPAKPANPLLECRDRQTFKGYLLKKSIASTKEDCFNQCADSVIKGSHCDTSVFIRDRRNGSCHLASTKKGIGLNPTMTTLKGDVCSVPLLQQCSQGALPGLSIGNSIPNIIPDQCSENCQRVGDSCTHYRFRYEQTQGQFICELFGRDYTKPAIYQRSGEFICPKNINYRDLLAQSNSFQVPLNCGQFAVKAVETSEKWDNFQLCKYACKVRDNCHAFIFRNGQCLMYRFQNDAPEVMYLPGEKMCEVRKGSVPPVFPAGGCQPKTFLKGKEMANSRSVAASAAECMKKCEAKGKECTHAFFRHLPGQDLKRPRGQCRLVHEDPSMDVLKIYARESVCKKEPAVVAGQLRCGDLHMWGKELKREHASDLSACQQRCSAECEAFSFLEGAAPSTANCVLYKYDETAGSLQRDHNQHLCTTGTKAKPYVFPLDGCPSESPISGTVIYENRHEYSTCIAECQWNRQCTHFMFRAIPNEYHPTYGQCRLFAAGMRPSFPVSREKKGPAPVDGEVAVPRVSVRDNESVCPYLY